MKKRVVKYLFLFFAFSILSLSLSLVSAAWFSDFFSPITGNVVVNNCVDSDNGVNIYEKGVINYSRGPIPKYFEDICFSGFITEYYCSGDLVRSERVKCENGCSNGACKKLEQEKPQLNTTQTQDKIQTKDTFLSRLWRIFN